MLKRNITYTDFNDKEVTETFYFNMSKTELLELELSTDGGFADLLQRIIDSKDNKTLVELFKKVILGSYGQKSEDGRRFVKTDQLREEFSQSAAYSALFMELATDDEAASMFIHGIIPSDMVPELDKQLKQTVNSQTELLPPPPPAA